MPDVSLTICSWQLALRVTLLLFTLYLGVLSSDVDISMLLTSSIKSIKFHAKRWKMYEKSINFEKYFNDMLRMCIMFWTLYIYKSNQNLSSISLLQRCVNTYLVDLLIISIRWIGTQLIAASCLNMHAT